MPNVPNDIPDAKRLIPPDQSGSELSAKRLPYAAIVAVVAVPIVVGGIALFFGVRRWAGANPDAALNDTRSPLAEEITDPEVTIDPVDPARAPNPSAATGTDAPFKMNEAYPEIDPNKPPLAVAVNPALGGSSSNGASSNGASISGGALSPEAALSPATSSIETAYGHLAYPEADPSRLTSAGTFVRENYERAEQLDFEAAQAFEQMRQAAQAEGVNLMPVSGFRAISAQKELFESQVDRKGSAESAAASSAPPGYSEHHTGYAIDIADGDYPESDIKQSFENTPTYQWLIRNAGAYGFEESFPKNNAQGVTFEPWHWRYVDSERARQIFSEARRRYPSR